MFFMQTIPKAFSQSHFPPAKLKVVLRNSAGKTWEVNCIYHAKRHSLSGGWSTFVRENSLKQGGTCRFELVEKNVMQVHVLWLSKKWSIYAVLKGLMMIPSHVSQLCHFWVCEIVAFHLYNDFIHNGQMIFANGHWKKFSLATWCCMGWIFGLLLVLLASELSRVDFCAHRWPFLHTKTISLIVLHMSNLAQMRRYFHELFIENGESLIFFFPSTKQAFFLRFLIGACKN